MEIFLGNLKKFLLYLNKGINEKVGTIIGEKNNDVIESKIIFPVKNILDSRTEFLADPFDMLVSHIVAENYSLQVVALYHTHPIGNPVPSIKDIAGMKLWPIPWLIISKNGIRAWILNENEVEEVKIT
ncbi:MAG: M67 family metallopeptidase [Caldisphaera sp.]|jgi:proteasome lid subunit RPN8/RPN11